MTETLTKKDLQDVLKDYPTKQELKETLEETLQNYPAKQELQEALQINNKELVTQLGALLENAIHGIDGIQENIDSAKEVKEDIEKDIKPRLVSLENKIVA